ncbi:MAG: 50S ribosomal protein L29 [Deltaproteobacteria bacterium]|nr:50S ribosomal protein L29 [Deltaproteobacteria bacterium]
MELEKLKKDEIKALSGEKLLETEISLRNELVNLRMDIYAEKGKHAGKTRKIKKNLARVLTVKNILRKEKQTLQTGSVK